jgi:hypothetical protein
VARLRAGSPQGVRSPAAREAAAVRRSERDGVVRFRVGRERSGSGESRSECLTAVKGKTGLP